MGFSFEQTLLDNPFVERVWRTQTETAEPFTSLAAARWELVVTRYKGKTTLTVRGPETKATLACSPTDTEFFGIVFKPGIYMPHLPVATILNKNDITLPAASSRSFWLDSAAWQYPDYDNADVFIDRMVRRNLLVRDRVVESVLQNLPHGKSIRTLRRHFLQATGLTFNTFKQIERARHALLLLQERVSILDTVEQAGYFDQAHLTRALKHFTGQTPASIVKPNSSTQVSLLYKTET